MAKRGEMLKPHKGEQRTLNELWQSHQSGKSYGDLVDWLNAKGIRTKNGGRWDRLTIFYIIKRLRESQTKNQLD